MNVSHKKKLQIGTGSTPDILLQRIPRPCNLPQQASDHPPADTSTGLQQATTTEHNTFDEIPQLEEEEDWENGQSADADTNLIDRHNTHTESERI